MAEAAKTLTLSEEYLLKEKEEKLDTGAKPAEESEAKSPVSATSEEVASSITEEVGGGSNEVNSASADESSGESSAAIAESNGTAGSAGGSDIEATEAAAEESSGNAEQEDSGDQEGEETPEIKLETAPADFRFPTTNQSRHCFTRYIEYHRCVAAKGEGAPECDKFAKYYRSLCPGEWNLVNNLISVGSGREAAFSAAVLGDNALMEKAWREIGMLAEAVLHVHV